MNTILRNSVFQVDINGHGGNHRTAQLVELMSVAGFEVSDIPKEGQTNRISRYLNGAYFLAKYNLTTSLSYQLIGLCGHYYLVYKNFLENYSGIKLLLWEETGNYIIPCIAKEKLFTVIAVPQNLESLVVGYVNVFTRKKSLARNFEDEIKYLSQADAVFCISREEQWLLKSHNIDADFLPYYPPEVIVSSLLKLRKLRQNSLKKRFLILGTAHNPPTKVGMIEQIQWLKQVNQEIEFEVDIAGYGTEQLETYCDLPNFTLHGTVDSQQLDTLLINAKAVLLHQKAGVGALTRIPEMLIAGIPVIANGNACRSAFSYPGVYCYDSLWELADLMSKSLDSPDILPRPVAAEKRFIHCLQQLADDSSSRQA
ncbi:MAG: hypothetical protein AB1861_18955 [Cyanobacteriota bacterium]